MQPVSSAAAVLAFLLSLSISRFRSNGQAMLSQPKPAEASYILSLEPLDLLQGCGSNPFPSAND